MSNSSVMNMTTGSPIKHILRFTGPLLIGNLFQQLYNMVDSLVVGNFVGANALASVGACGSINYLFFSLSLGLSAGIGVIVSHYFGAEKEEHVKSTIANAIYVLAATAILLSIIAWIAAPAFLRLLNTPETILDDAVIYMRTTCAGLIVIAAYNGISSILRALGDSKTPLYFLIVACILNIILDLVFVICFHMSVFGVALATVIAQAVAAVSAIIYAVLKNPYFKLTRKELNLNMPIITRTFRLGLPLAFQTSLISISCIALQGIVNSFGETVVATYTIVNRIEQIVQQPYTSLGTALTTFTGQNIGAGKIDRVKDGYKKTVWVVLIFSLCLLPIAFLFGEQLISIFVKEPEVIAMGKIALRITSICYFPLGMIYVPRSVINGAGDASFAMMNGMSEVLCRIIFSLILTNIPALGYWGIWITTGATWTVTALVCIWRYIQGKWKNMVLHT